MYIAVFILVALSCVHPVNLTSSSFRQGHYPPRNVNRNFGNQNNVKGPSLYEGIKGDNDEDSIRPLIDDEYGEDVTESDIHFDLTNIFLSKKGTTPQVMPGQRLPTKRQPLHRQTTSSITVNREDYPGWDSHLHSSVVNHVRQNLELRRHFLRDQQKFNNIYAELGNLVHSLNEINEKIDKVIADTNQRLTKISDDTNKRFERMRSSINLVNTKLGGLQTIVETTQGQIVQEIGGIQKRTNELKQKCDNNYATLMSTLQTISQMTTNPMDRIGHFGNVGEFPSER